mmetsp:Transcript_37060/g.111016  ORF Transcript_37060/g.111016 Transcript_37060/m.111016 type:complete len:101 (-) Transcript_37060:426-728(-)
MGSHLRNLSVAPARASSMLTPLPNKVILGTGGGFSVIPPAIAAALPPGLSGMDTKGMEALRCAALDLALVSNRPGNRDVVMGMLSDLSCLSSSSRRNDSS